MNTETAHTPTPWSLSDLSQGNGRLLRETLRIYGDGKHIATITPNTANALTPDSDAEARANAAAIVRAVNAHDALVDALKANIAQWESWKAFEGEEPACITQARAALAKAKGGAK